MANRMTVGGDTTVTITDDYTATTSDGTIHANTQFKEIHIYLPSATIAWSIRVKNIGKNDLYVHAYGDQVIDKEEDAFDIISNEGDLFIYYSDGTKVWIA